MNFNRLNIGIIKAQLKEKDDKVGDFVRTDMQGEYYNYAEVVDVWKPETAFEEEIYKQRCLNLGQSPMLVQKGDIVRIPSNREPIIDDEGNRYVLLHQKDVLEWYRDDSSDLKSRLGVIYQGERPIAVSSMSDEQFKDTFLK